MTKKEIYVAARRPKFPLQLDDMLIGRKAHEELKKLAKTPFVKKKCDDPLEDFYYNQVFKSKEK